MHLEELHFSDFPQKFSPTAWKGGKILSHVAATCNCPCQLPQWFFTNKIVNDDHMTVGCLANRLPSTQNAITGPQKRWGSHITHFPQSRNGIECNYYQSIVSQLSHAPKTTYIRQSILSDIYILALYFRIKPLLHIHACIHQLIKWDHLHSDIFRFTFCVFNFWFFLIQIKTYQKKKPDLSLNK